MLLNELIKDEKKIDKILYSSGTYWDYKIEEQHMKLKERV